MLRLTTMGMFLAMIVLLVTTSVYGEATGVGASVQDADESAGVLARIQRQWPQIQPTSIAPGPAPGLYQLVILPANAVLYANPGDNWLVQGSLFHMEGGENLSQRALAGARLAALTQLPALDYFTFPASRETHRITVVTDIDCPYCRQLHKEISALNEAGVSVRYIMLPRAGLTSESYIKAVNAACDEQPEAALTRSFNGESLQQRSCANSIDQQWQLAHQLGAASTPMIIDEATGRSWPGYPGTQRLLSELQASP